MLYSGDEPALFGALDPPLSIVMGLLTSCPIGLLFNANLKGLNLITQVGLVGGLCLGAYWAMKYAVTRITAGLCELFMTKEQINHVINNYEPP